MATLRIGTKLVRFQSQVRQVGTHTLRIRQVQAQNQNKALQVVWDDGTVGQFSYVWLRDSAPAHRPESLNELNLAVKPKELRLSDERDALTIEWPPYLKAQYTSNWLRDHLQPAGKDQTEDKAAECWFKSSAFKPPTFNLETLQQDESARALLQGQFRKIGLAVVKGCVDLSLDNLIKLVPVGSNGGVKIARLDEEVCKVQELHSGCPEHEKVPKVAAMKVLGVNGLGSFQVVDSFAVANEFRAEHRSLFEFLAETPVEYEKTVGNATAKHPTIVLDAEENVKQVIFNNVQRSTHLQLPLAQADLFFRALKAFNNLLYKNAVNIELGNGDILLINNHRILLGHTAFPSTEGKNPTVEEYFYN